jgi:hypothetical protein
MSVVRAAHHRILNLGGSGLCFSSCCFSFSAALCAKSTSASTLKA